MENTVKFYSPGREEHVDEPGAGHGVVTAKESGCEIRRPFDSRQKRPAKSLNRNDGITSGTRLGRSGSTI